MLIFWIAMLTWCLVRVARQVGFRIRGTHTTAEILEFEYVKDLAMACDYSLEHHDGGIPPWLCMKLAYDADVRRVAYYYLGDCSNKPEQFPDYAVGENIEIIYPRKHPGDIRLKGDYKSLVLDIGAAIFISFFLLEYL